MEATPPKAMSRMPRASSVTSGIYRQPERCQWSLWVRPVPCPEEWPTLTSLDGGGPNGAGDNNIRRHVASRCRGSVQ
jgi:hypothetical protein